MAILFIITPTKSSFVVLSGGNKTKREGKEQSIFNPFVFIGRLARYLRRQPPLGSKINNHSVQLQYDKKLVYSLSKSRIPTLRQLKYLHKYLSRRETWLIRSCLAVAVGSFLFWAGYFYFTHREVAPISGGEYREALVGSPKLLNPLYASVNDVDQDLVYLVYSSLFRHDESGRLKGDLAESYESGEDSKTFIVRLRSDAKWHSGGSVTADDVIFTFNAIKDSVYKSPLRSSFSGVEAEKLDDRMVKFNLPEPYAAFLDFLTFGILPSELWSQIPSDTAHLASLNLNPVGSGPYRSESIVKGSAGDIKEYRLARNADYYGSAPYLDRIVFKFFPTPPEAIAALNENTVDGISYLNQEEKKEILSAGAFNFYELDMPQYKAIFFNPDRNPRLTDKKVRQALAYALDKEKIAAQVSGEAKIVHSPILPSAFAYHTDVVKYNHDTASATRLLNEAGWEVTEIGSEEEATTSEEKSEVRGEEAELAGPGLWRKKGEQLLIVTLKTAARRENETVAGLIKEAWENIGVKTVIEAVDPGQAQSEVIKPRSYEALLYSVIVGTDPDMYPLWHSSQIGENGLNLANFSNKEVDLLLEDARRIKDQEARKTNYIKFQDIIAAEVPAIFLYSPTYTYVQAKKIKGFNVKAIMSPRDRFYNVNEWYTKTGKRLNWQ